MAKKRDYKAEYARRIASAKKRGLSRSQARGHARVGEKAIRAKIEQSDPRLESALKLMRNAQTQAKAAKEAGVSVERLRRFIYNNSLATRKKAEWHFTDNRKREMLVISQGQARRMWIDGFEQASLNGDYLNAVKAFINSNNAEFLGDFADQSVRDAKGKSHLFETDPNTLYALAASGGEIFEEIYRLITN